ncbi:DUF2637 domain-containing protein [Streptomyces abyssalis]|uniref:DUF2637 domain-containing protein n=1 Tax=Streptomyces abyssalis TaxID=933944 RepID=UPI001FE1FAD9|nr:DUF2637 domain-containing protein [Streptomyces abyssalis]
MSRPIAPSVRSAQRGGRQSVSAPGGAEGVGGSSQRVALDVWARRGGGLIVTAVAAYSSYEHQRDFALRGGADAVGAALWPLSVDGLLLLATVGLLKTRPKRQPKNAMRCLGGVLAGDRGVTGRQRRRCAHSRLAGGPGCRVAAGCLVALGGASRSPLWPTRLRRGRANGCECRSR